MSRSVRKSAAFTLIEVLISISIIAILSGLVFVGFKVVGNGGRMRNTRTTLETCRALLSDAQVLKGLPGIKAIYTRPPNSATAYYFAFPPLPSSTPVNAPVGTPAIPVPTPIPAPVDSTKNGNVSADLYVASSHDIRFDSDAVVRTQMVMQRLQAFPANRTSINQLPANSFLTWTFGMPSTPRLVGVKLQIPLVQVTPQRYAPTPPVLVDSWGNPIIYVPPAGLSGITFKDRQPPLGATSWVITSARARVMYNSSSKTNPQDADYYNFDPGATGFWASAGPDGDFTTGDDNLYSFEGL